MGKSLKLHLIVFFLVCLCIYIFLLRTISQQLAFEFIAEKVNAELILLISDETTFSSDVLISKSNFFKNSKLNSLIKCSHNKVLYSDDKDCNFFKDSSIRWKNLTNSKQLLIEFAAPQINGSKWQIIRKKTQDNYDYLGINESEINQILSRTWEIRDHVMLRIFPILIVSLVLFSIYISSHIVKIIEKIQFIVKNTDVKNLSQATMISSPYQEFQPFIDIFQDLRLRLKASFDQATRFSSDASHELKTPLTILRGYAERGIKTAPDGSQEQLHFAMMSEEIDRLINITEKLLTLARSDAGKLEPTFSHLNLSQLIETLINDAPQLNPDLRFSSNVQKNLYWYCDAQLIHQLLYNLYSNAVKYNITDGWVHFNLHSENNVLVIEILNSSSNLPVNLPERAFDRFYRAEEAHSNIISGSGLGLSLCKEISKIHNGEITLSVNAYQHVSAKFTAPLITETTTLQVAI